MFRKEKNLEKEKMKKEVEELKRKYYSDKKWFEKNEPYMDDDERVINILLLSYERNMYVMNSEFFNEEECFEYNDFDEKEGFKTRFEEIYSAKENETMFRPVIGNGYKGEGSDKVHGNKSFEQVPEDNRENFSQNLAFEDFYKLESKYRPFKCQKPGCNKKYTSLYGLKYHEKNGHNKEMKYHKPYKCTVEDCEKSYKNANGLKYHLDNGHK